MSVEERTYRSWEKAKTSPTTSHLQQLADSFGRTLPELLSLQPDAGTFPKVNASAQPDATNQFIIALLNDPILPADTKTYILKIWKGVLSIFLTGVVPI